MHLACVQFDVAWQDKPRNFARVDALLAQAHLPADTLVLLPEMFATGFSMAAERIAEPDEPASLIRAFLADLARRHHCTLIAGAALRDKNGAPQNRALVISPTGELLASYAKFHPFSPVKEADHYSPGQQIVSFLWQSQHETLTVSPMICYDLRFPELFRAATHRHGAQLLAVVANWPVARHEHWFALLRARAVENQCFVAGCNRAGADPHASYAGGSVIFDPKGNILAQAGTEETILQARISPAELHQYRTEFPALKDLRPELYPP